MLLSAFANEPAAVLSNATRPTPKGKRTSGVRISATTAPCR
jgi:hypothetical protein